MTAVAATAASASAAEDLYRGYEQPPYTVVWAKQNVEYRRYGTHLVAEVIVPGDRRQAANRGFRELAGYIFGGNESGAKIAMTVPVSQVPRADGTWIVRFMVPSIHSEASLPVPNSNVIRFVDVPGGDQLVVQFSGLFSERRMPGYVAQLQAVALEKGLRLADVPHLYFYDDPMTLPWRRRNEIAFDIL